MAHKANITVNSIDENHLLYGNFIGVQYVFEKSLDTSILKTAISELLKQLPSLGGRYSSKNSAIENIDLSPNLLVRNHLDASDKLSLSPANSPYLYQPKRRDVLRGRAPLSTFTYSKIENGESVLGVAISHLLTDAAGFHKIMQHFGNLYTALEIGAPLPEACFKTSLNVFRFGTSRSKTETLNLLTTRNLPRPIPLRGIMGRIIKSLIIKAMDKSISRNTPVRIHFSPEDVKRLKNIVLTESGESWISTNMALCAHFTSLIAQLAYGEDTKTEMQIGQLLDLRNRYFEADYEAQNNFIGNAIFIDIERTSFPNGLQNTSRGELAKYFKRRQSNIDASDIHTRLGILSDCIRHGYTNPELDVKNPIISLNNQSKMPVYEIRFSGQKPIQIYPQDVGDNIMFFPAANGGIDIYIRDLVNPLSQQQLLTSEWQEVIFNFR